MKTIYFVRHGETEANVQRVLAGARTDSLLTEMGVQQARGSAEIIRSLRVDAIVSSPLTRAYHTAQIIADGIGFAGQISKSALFTERDYGSATGLPYKEAGELLDSMQAVGVETINELANRAQLALDWLMAQDSENIVVVSHGGFGQMFGTIAEVKQPADFLSYPHLGKAEYYEFKLEDTK